MEFEHKKIGKLVIEELTQRQVEVMSRTISDAQTIVNAEYYGSVVRGAIKAEAVLEPAGLTVETVDRMKPYMVTWYAQCINKAYVEATTVPNE